MKVRHSLLAAIVLIMSVGCKKNDSVPTKLRVDYTLPSSYNFTNIDSNAARIILSMVSQMESYITTGNTANVVLSAPQMKSMLANTGSFFRDTTVAGISLKLNTSGVNLKSLVTPAAAPFIEAMFDSIAVSSQSTKTAANGVAGISDKKTLLSGNGIYWRQLFTKTIMGILIQHLTTDVYLSDSLNSSISVAAKIHAWDQAFFLWAVPVNFPANRAGVKYWGSYSSQIDSGVNRPVVNLTGVNSNPTLLKAFLNGRMALNNSDLFTAQDDAANIIAIYEKMEAAAALHELNEAIGNIPNGASASVGNISEGIGFINSWKFNSKRKIASDAQVNAVIALFGTNLYNLTQANLETIKSAISAIYGWDAVKSYL
ncbi:MAG: DUF4856 domain-containing protein [Chitinophagaceae bacterium]